jgi:hypothetical protein
MSFDFSKKEPIEKIAIKLSWEAARQSMKIFSNPIFREFCNFKKISKIEQDRIWNELTIACLILPIFAFEAPDLRSDEKLRAYLRDLANEIPKAHVKNLKNMGIEEKFLADWRKLIQMRKDEYEEDKIEAKSAAMQVEEEYSGPLNLEKLEGIQLMLPINVIAIGCHRHICRSKTEGKDDLLKMIVKWLGKYYVEIRLPAEGINLTFWKRLQVYLSKVLEKLIG